MTSWQHQDWINHGRPDSGLARPLMQLRDVLRGAGYLVYDQPNDAHLDAQPPEDHTYYSETGWPSGSPKWWRHAIDIMPSHGGADLYALGQRIVADRNAGRATWIKYINVPTDASLRGAVQHGWKPGHYQRTSSDTGHIHISSITGVENLDAPYNPLAAVAAATGGDDMLTPDEHAEIVEGWLSPKNVLHYRLRAIADGEDPGLQEYFDKGWSKGVGLAQIAAKLDALAAAVATPAAAGPALTDAQVAAQADRIAAALAAHPDVPLGDADKPAIVDAVKQALREGTAQ